MKRLFFYATLFAAATWLAFAELNPPSGGGNDGVGGLVQTNHNGSVTLTNGVFAFHSMTNAAWPGWSVGNFSYGVGTSTTPVPVEVYGPLNVQGWLQVNARGGSIQRWGFHVFDFWGKDPDYRLSGLAGKTPGEAAIYYFRPSSNDFGVLHLGSDSLNAVGLFVHGNTGYVGINNRTPSSALDVNGSIKALGLTLNGGVTGILHYEPAAFDGRSGITYGTNLLWSADISPGLRRGLLAAGGGLMGVFSADAATSSAISMGVTAEDYRRLRVLASGAIAWGTGTHAADVLLSLTSRSNLLFTAAITVSNTVNTTGTLTGGKVAIGAPTNRLEVVGSELLWITGTTTQRITLGSYP
jgi:hypothetical protein